MKTLNMHARLQTARSLLFGTGPDVLALARGNAERSRTRRTMASARLQPLRSGLDPRMQGDPFMQSARRTQMSGFTLLELLVVMVILGLLVGYVAPRYFQQVGKSEVKMAQAQIDSLQKALDVYRLDTGRYPSTDQGLKALVERPANEPKWAGPYLKKGVPLDPWGHAYLYRYPGERNELDLVSLGKDGQPGGAGEAADLTNH
jgi:general secretion pathway protein G